MTTHVCERCGKEFRISPSDAAVRRFCSFKCKSGPIEDRIFGNTTKNSVSGCWEWNKARDPRGYGATWVDGRKDGAHRVAWALVNGPIPEGLCVLHHCDNPPCCNPVHLFLGTKRDNAADKVSKGRQPVGIAVTTSKLTEEDVAEIRSTYRPSQGGFHAGKSPFSSRGLGRKFGVSYRLVLELVHGRAWRHLVK